MYKEAYSYIISVNIYYFGLSNVFSIDYFFSHFNFSINNFSSFPEPRSFKNEKNLKS